MKGTEPTGAALTRGWGIEMFTKAATLGMSAVSGIGNLFKFQPRQHIVPVSCGVKTFPKFNQFDAD